MVQIKEDSEFPKTGYRVKRQQEPDPADQFFDSVFQIPISTLNAVNGLIKSTRPVIRRARERIQQQYQSWQEQASNGGRPNRGRPNGRPRPAGREEDHDEEKTLLISKVVMRDSSTKFGRASQSARPHSVEAASQLDQIRLSQPARSTEFIELASHFDQIESRKPCQKF
ncbi:hypothetical protein V9T40_009334 [Parthenolecanium corni]|uniref:Uncharacterized protein n=1 Tax=Parthenolecanium corni TaxID=536013 RepID=A0AAN9Y6N0_9HEMI